MVIKMNNFNKILLLTSAVICYISIFTPVVFHISTESVYQFWLWGTSLSFNLSTGEINSTQNTQLEFLIPALASMVFIIISSSLIIKTTLKGFRDDNFNSKMTILGGSLMLVTPILLMIIWQLVHTLIAGYPNFWGSTGGYNYFMPSFSIYMQFIAGIMVVISIIFMKVKKK